jgi:hypothetical protein
VVTRYPARTHEGDLQNMTDQNAQPGFGAPPAGIQWQKGTTYPLEAKVVDNTPLPEAKITGDLLPTFK